jgi:hypothetical protein
VQFSVANATNGSKENFLSRHRWYFTRDNLENSHDKQQKKSPGGLLATVFFRNSQDDDYCLCNQVSLALLASQVRAGRS